MGIHKMMVKSIGMLALLVLVACLTGDGNPDARELNDWPDAVDSTTLMSTSFSARFSSQGFAPITSQDARLQNGLAPFSAKPIEIALPLLIPMSDRNFAQVGGAIDCMTAAIFYEAGSESAIGKRAVAQVVLNRVRHPAFPNSVCGVIFEGSQRITGCQFTFTCDGSLSRKPTQQGWSSARAFAQAALAGAVEPSVGMATHYHADYVRPYWAASLDKVAQIGVHIFYRWRGSWGRRRAFNQTVQLHALQNWPGDLSWHLRDNEFEGSPNVPILVNEVVPPQSAADEAAALTAAPAKMHSPPQALQLRAGRTGGVLIADENSATLIVD